MKNKPNPPAKSASANDDAKKARWPVNGPSDLTIGHIPPKLRDQVVRSLLQDARLVGQWIAQQMDSINDARNEIRQVSKNLDKDGQRLNQLMQASGVGPALVRLGIAKGPESQAAAGGPDAAV